MKIRVTLSNETVEINHPKGSATVARNHLASWLRMLLRARWKR